MKVFWLEQTQTDVPSENNWLADSEAVNLDALRFTKRRSEWRLGRWTAKCALAAYLNMPQDLRSFQRIEIRPASDGAPEVFVGNVPGAATISLSHRSGGAACSVAAAGVSIGCDLELVEPRSSGFVADFFTVEERARVASMSSIKRDRLVTLIWSAKESALKSLRTGLRLDTRSVIVDAFADSCGPSEWSPLSVRHSDAGGAVGRIFSGWWQCANGMVRTVVADPIPDSPILLEAPKRVSTETVALETRTASELELVWHRAANPSISTSS